MPRFAIDAEQPAFLRDLRQAARRHPTLLRDDLPPLIERIAENPEEFPELIGLDAEVRKSRLGVRKAAIGKSGGYRLLFQVHRDVSVITLLALYYKPERTILSFEEIRRRMKA
jgi:mRNA-degrading endonuclease RelE of RelBE toxin-antitoxin system